MKPLQVHKADDGYHSDGGGLFLFVRGPSSTWVFRFTAPNGKQRYMGLGAAERSMIASLTVWTQARKAPSDARDLAQRGLDPIDERKAAKAKVRARQLRSPRLPKRLRRRWRALRALITSV